MNNGILKLSIRIGFFVLLGLSFYLSINVPGKHSLVNLLGDKFCHASGYFLLVLLFDLAFQPGRHPVPKSVAVLIYSILLECIQYTLPYREFSVLDILANAAGIGIFLFLRRIFPYRHFRLDASSRV